MTAAQKAESQQEDWPGVGIWVRSPQTEGKDDITRLSEEILQLRVAVQKPQKTTISNPQQWEVKELVMAISVMPGVKVKIKAMVRDVIDRGLNVFNARVGE